MAQNVFYFHSSQGIIKQKWKVDEIARLPRLSSRTGYFLTVVRVAMTPTNKTRTTVPATFGFLEGRCCHWLSKIKRNSPIERISAQTAYLHRPPSLISQ